MKKGVFSFIIFLLVSFCISAQDAHFSQFYANPLYLNPALAGTADGNRLILNHRQQWTKPISFITSAVSLDGNFNTVKSGWGMQIVNDNQANGLLVQTSFSLTGAHRIEIQKNKYLGMGLKIGAYQKRFDWSDLVFEDQIDQRNGAINPTNERFGKNKIMNADVSAGVLYYSKNLFAGVSVNHLNRPSEEFSVSSQNRLALKYTAHIGGILEFNYPGKEQFISPSVIFEKQGTFQYLNLGMYYGIDNLSLGLYYRWNDAIIALVGVNYNSFKFGYSYDLTVSAVANGQHNSHEISLAYLFELPKSYNRKGRYKGKCPRIYKSLF